MLNIVDNYIIKYNIKNIDILFIVIIYFVMIIIEYYGMVFLVL